MIAQKIAYNVLFAGASKAISIGIALFTIGLLSRYLGTAGFGQYTLALTYLAFLMAFADMGLHAVATREISREGAPENEIINKIFTLRLAITSALFLLSVTTVWFLPYSQEMKTAILVITGAFLFSSSYSLLNGVFQKHIAMDRVAIAELCGKIVQMSIIISLIYFKLPFLFAVIAIFAAMVTNFTLIFLFARKYIKIRLDWDLLYWKKFMAKAYPLGISAIATFLYFKVNAFILGWYHPDEDVGIYGAATKIIETIVFFPAMVVGLVLPLLSRYIFTDKKAFSETVESTIKFFTLALIPLIVSMVFLAPEAIALINGKEFIDAVLVLQIGIFSFIGIFFGHFFINVAIAANLQKTLTILLVTSAIFSIFLNMSLIPEYSARGAALSSVITELFVMGVTLWLITKKTSFRFILKKPLLYGIAALLMIGTNIILPLNAFISAIIGVTIYAIFLYITGVVTKKDLHNIRPKAGGVA